MLWNYEANFFWQHQNQKGLKQVLRNQKATISPLGITISMRRIILNLIPAAIHFWIK